MSTAINGFHIFTVKEYSRLHKACADFYIASDTFTVGGYDWEVRFYPYIEDPMTAGFVGLQLMVNDCETTVEASFDVTLLDQSELGEYDVIASTDYNPYTKDDWWGLDIMRNLSWDSYHNDDSVTFSCMVRVVQSGIKPHNYRIIPRRPEMEKDFKYLLNSEIGSDIVFRVKDVTFKAHKAILAARSPVFKAQFYGFVGNPNLDEVELMDIEPTVFKAMLLFIYSDKLPDSQEIMGSMPHMIRNLLVAADRFGLERLKQLCEAKLCEELNVDVVAITLSLAHDHHCYQLKAVCMDFAIDNLQAVMQTEAYKYVEKSCPSLVLELLPKIAELLLTLND